MSQVLRILLWVGIAVGALGVGVLGLVAYAPYADGPFYHLPGGRLRAPDEPALPDDWAPWGAAPYVELETNPDRPRSLLLGLLVADGEAFIPATLRPDTKRWPKDVERDSRVRVRVDGRVYAARVTPVRDADLHARLARLGSEKYSPAYFQPARTRFYRLSPRPK